MIHSYFERKYDEVLTFNIVHFPDFEISASLLLAPNVTVSKFNKRRGRLLEEIGYCISIVDLQQVNADWECTITILSRI